MKQYFSQSLQAAVVSFCFCRCKVFFSNVDIGIFNYLNGLGYLPILIKSLMMLFMFMWNEDVNFVVICENCSVESKRTNYTFALIGYRYFVSLNSARYRSLSDLNPRLCLTCYIYCILPSKELMLSVNILSFLLFLVPLSRFILLASPYYCFLM